MLKFKDPEQKREFMLDTPIPRLVVQMSLPSIASMLVASLYNLSDTFFVSQLGTYATGAVGINAAIDSIIMMAGFFLSSRAASLNSRLLGSKEDKRATRVLSTTFFSAMCAGLLVLIFGLSFKDPLLRLLGASDLILPYSRDYARYVLLAAPYMTASYVLNQGLRAEGSSAYAMIGTICGAVLNIGLDPIFIFVCNWGVAGASAATAISKFVSFSILLLPYLRRKTLVRIGIRHIGVPWKDAADVLKMGSPSLFRLGLATLAGIVLNRLAVGYGESALAAISVANRFAMFLTSACLGFGQGLQPVVGFSWGARRYDRIWQSFRFAVLFAAIGIAVPSLLAGIFAEHVLGWFTQTDAEMVAIGMFALRVQCLSMPLRAFSINVTGLCAGMGRARGAAILGLSRQGICFFPILPLMVWIGGVWGIAAVQGVSDILTIFIALPIAARVRRDLRQLMSNPDMNSPDQ